MKKKWKRVTQTGLISRQLLAIARTTFVESIQQPVALLIMITATVASLLIPIFQFHRFSEDGRLARDGGLSIMLVFGLVLAAGMAGRSVADEIERGTAAAVLGKPVTRHTFILAKWIGVCGVVTLFWLGALSATMLAERGSAHFVIRQEFTGYITDLLSLTLGFGFMVLALSAAALRHYLKRQRFGITAFTGVALSQLLVILLTGFYNRMGELYPLHGEAACCDCGVEHAHAGGGWLLYHPELNLRVVPAALLVLFLLYVFAALATALATRLSTSATLAICAGVLLIGLTGDTLLVSTPVLSLHGVVSGVLPDAQNFWLCDALAHDGHISWHYVIDALLYAATTCALFLTTGCLTLNHRDLG